jgi:exonuclease SbcC
MILKTLTIENFKSYKNKTIIDFRKMPLNHLFLIQGKTGAGKSSILDAIIYALYGSEKNLFIHHYLTNSVKENLLQNPHHYKGKVISLVELAFEYKNQNYKIVRTFKIKNFRKENPTIDEISEFEEKILQENQVIPQIPIIRHLSREQFTKSIIIPQNQFDEFLKADVKDKEAILKNIFNTEKYELFAEFLKEKLSLIESKIEKVKNNLENILKRNQIEKSIEDPIMKEIFLQKIKDYKTKIQLNESEIQKKDNQKKEIENLYNKQQNKGEILKELISHLHAKEELQKKEEVIQSQKEKIFNAKKVIDIYPVYKNIQDIQIELKFNLKEFEEQKRSLENIKKELEEKNKVQQQLENQKEIIENKKIRIKEIEKITPKFSMFKRIQSEIYEIQKEKIQLEKMIQKNKSKYDKINQQLEEIYKSYFVKQLKEKEPCPICGSTEHPHPFRGILNEDPEKILLEKTKLEQELKELEEELQKKEKSLNNKEKEIQDIKSFIEQNEYDLTNLENIEKTLKKELEALKIEIYEYDKQTKRLQKEMSEITKKEGEHVGTIQQLENQIKQKQKLLKEKEELLSELLQQNQLTKEKIEEYYLKQDQINRLEKEVQDYESNKTKIDSLIEKNIQKLKKEYNFIYKNIDDISLQLQTTQKDVLEIKNKINEISNEINILHKESGKLTESIKNLKSDFEEFTKEKEIYDNFIHQYKKYQSLYQIISNTNPKRISLHRYVIQVYFETVIKFANERLKKIEPRYILKASEEAKAGKRIAGLNIKVLDKWEGERNIESLSGGESFYVSLALALGLYDIIHTNFSNLHFDFLFIDEGFGSLDEQTLQKVLATINEIFILRDGNSQKQIGLISHVESMRQQIPYQIIINNVNGISSVNYKY